MSCTTTDSGSSLRGVAATTAARAAADVRWRAIVIGGGPAGSALAARLAARGLAVLLLDAAGMPRPKLCGCCLSATAVAELAALAAATRAGPDPLPAGAMPLAVVHLATPAVSAALPLAGGAVVSREALDAAGVRRAIAAGAAWLPGTRATAIKGPADGGGAAIVELGGAATAAACLTLAADLVVVATGLATTVRDDGDDTSGERIAVGSRVGLGTTLADSGGWSPPPGELVMAVASQGYCGIVRLEDGRIDLAAAVDRSPLVAAGSPAAAIGAILAATGFGRPGLFGDGFVDRLREATFRGTPALTRARPPVSAAGRIIRIGDAAGYVEPFTGEGMGWALASARLCDEVLGPVLAAANGPVADLAAPAARFARLHARRFSGHHARCRRIALAVRRPWLVGSAVRLARIAPGLAARFVPLVVGAASPQETVG